MAAELVLALAHMHSRCIVYRDLKPANVLIDAAGHLRMVDMGMASVLDPETAKRKSVCGTQRYMVLYIYTYICVLYLYTWHGHGQRARP